MECEVGEVVEEGRYRLCNDSVEGVKKDEPQRLKPGNLTAFTARLKSCPDKTRRDEHFDNEHGSQL
jgi:hypothetical protein